MPTDVPMGCSCGTLRGVARGLTPELGTRGICYCDDCQSFAHFLGRADEILDEHAGTDIFQISPARIELTAGTEQLACISLTPRLVRWYADCCGTPIGNTLPVYQLPFVGLIHSCIQFAKGQSADAVLGPIRWRVHGRYAKGDRGQLDAYDRASLSLIWRFARMVLAARLRGDHKRSPFFDPRTGEPTVTPRMLNDHELQQIARKRNAFPAKLD